LFRLLGGSFNPTEILGYPKSDLGSLGINPKKTLGSKLGLIWDFDS